ncbi:MAG: BrnA antitoxin family protein [Nitrospirota bacterium]
MREKQVVGKEVGTRQEKINFSDIPELSEKQLSVMRRVGRPPHGSQPKKPIAIRLDTHVLDWIKKTASQRGMPYQSLINDILANRMKRAG